MPYSAAENGVPTASVQTVRLVIAVAAAHGVAPPQLLPRLGIEPQQLMNPDGRVPAAQAVRAWTVAAQLCGDPTFGLSAVQHLGPDSAGGLGWAMHASATFGAALTRLGHFLRLMNQYLTVRLFEEGTRARLRLEPDHEISPEDLRHPFECLLASVLKAGLRASGQPITPLAVTFRHAAPGPAGAPLPEAYQRAFALTPRFGQPHSELILPRAVLARPHLAPDPALLAITERHVRRLLEELPARESFAGQVRRVLAEELRHGEPSVGAVARRLRISQRTLQRRLRQEQTTVADLLEELRHQLALRHLREAKESIAEISFLLGYAEVRAFHRAFKRWTGDTPGTFREQLQRAAPPPHG